MVVVSPEMPRCFVTGCESGQCQSMKAVNVVKCRVRTDQMAQPPLKDCRSMICNLLNEGLPPSPPLYKLRPSYS